MGIPPDGALRAFIQRHTRLVDVPDAGIRLHVGDDVMALCRATGELLANSDPPLPFWAFPWIGGLALARHLREHPDEVTGRRVLDVGAGSGLCSIVAMRLGAASASAIDTDPLAAAAARLNARANGVRIDIVDRDVLDDPPPPADLVLAGDVAYEETMAARIGRWLDAAAVRGARVLLGDPGRTYLRTTLRPIASYDVAASRELEDRDRKRVTVYAVEPDRPAAPPGAAAPVRRS